MHFYLFCFILTEFFPLVILTNIPKESCVTAQGLLTRFVVNSLLQLKLLVKLLYILFKVDV